MSLSELWSLYGQNYIDALLATWGMTLESFAIAMVLAVAVTVMRVSPLKPLRVFGDLYVQVFRNIPGIALLIIVVYALPPLKVVLPYRTCVIVATVLLGSAFGSENFMSGINTVGVGQVEAARSTGAALERAAHDQPLYRCHAHHRARQPGAVATAGAHRRGELHQHALARRRRRVLYLGTRLPGHGLCGEPHWQLHR